MTPRQLYVVVHAANADHGTTQALAALDAGADGLALIDQFCDTAAVSQVAQNLRRLRPAAPVLLNFLDDNQGAAQAAAWAGCGLWWDSYDPLGDLPLLSQVLEAAVPVFGGVAFKYHPEPELVTGYKLGQAPALAAKGTFVPTTSGARTGDCPEVSKIRAFRRLLGPDLPLAIASGITADNIGTFLPLATHFLVGTSVEQRDAATGRRVVLAHKVSELAARVRGFTEK